jgi:hypothetical protein
MMEKLIKTVRDSIIKALIDALKLETIPKPLMELTSRRCGPKPNPLTKNLVLSRRKPLTELHNSKIPAIRHNYQNRAGPWVQEEINANFEAVIACEVVVFPIASEMDGPSDVFP